MEIFWDILWLYVGQTWGPTWHPMHTGYANLGPCVRYEERVPNIRDTGGEPSPLRLTSPSRLDRLLTVLALTLWSFAEAAPEERGSRPLEDIVPSACWPPMAARVTPTDSSRGDRRLYFGDIPPAVWETGYDHQLRPVARWALQWRLRLLPHLSFLGALPEAKKSALQIWAWPDVTPAQWQRLWAQQWDESLPPPNILPLSPWTRHVGTPPSC